MSYWELTHEPNIITKAMLDKALDDLHEMAAQPIHPPPMPQWVHDYIASINTEPTREDTTTMTTTTGPHRATFDAIRAEVLRVAAEQPDTAYTLGEDRQCDYFPTRTNPQGCIVGLAMRNLGLSLDGFSAISASDAICERLEIPSDVRDPVLYWLDRVQVRQDEGARWGDAVRTEYLP